VFAQALDQWGFVVVDDASDADVDVLIVDLVDRSDPAEVLSELPSDIPAVIVGASRELRMRAAPRLGRACALLGRNVGPDAILAAIVAVKAGLVVMEPSGDGDGETNWDDLAPGAEILTERELQVLRLIAVGASNKMIAGKLVISESTVRYHAQGLFAKLGAMNRAEAVASALRKGLL
jgi:DNA-binding NarL/FixJ family response regulator